MQAVLDLGPLTRQTADLAAAVRDEQLGGPTPCPDYDVRALLGHIRGLTTAFADAGRKRLGPTTDTSPQAELPDPGADWRERLPAELAALAEVWRDPEAWTGMTRAGGVDLPGEVAGLVAVDELVIHGWDLAVATGQAYAPDPAALDAAMEFLRQSTEPEDREGIFGPVVEPKPGAEALERAVALSGRDPGWRP
ncbi:MULTISPECIES: TIGR03086 family metal-binding protein [unclassified Streptomyces]|uniref:TIGR03086 family metal-binding protein n=1 Tax=unclassified Streptomyces TaxID=2593676 RepID=UPI0022B730D6|nr:MULTISPECIES: TIGR03086 family metal-binding protein [unclassified Streptomyces]MCZ7413698.1 TIGR03086 family metal-binding protein [Streptomyces sp. WMMC897]MCZ7430694.1 TIGR03086 family metal-binding protein [Streptomyces sp. WMMC1477]